MYPRGNLVDADASGAKASRPTKHLESRLERSFKETHFGITERPTIGTAY